MTGQDAVLREHEAKTLRLLADKLHAMTLVGGSPHLTEAMAAVTGFVRRLGDDVAAGSWSLHDDPAARRPTIESEVWTP